MASARSYLGSSKSGITPVRPPVRPVPNPGIKQPPPVGAPIRRGVPTFGVTPVQPPSNPPRPPKKVGSK